MNIFNRTPRRTLTALKTIDQTQQISTQQAPGTEAHKSLNMTFNSAPSNWVELESRILERLENWNDGAEARSKAEKERDAAIQERKTAIQSLIQEQARRIATEELCSELSTQRQALAEQAAFIEDERDSLRSKLAALQSSHQELSGEVQALTADKKFLQRELACTVDDLRLARETANEIMHVADKQASELAAVKSALTQAETARDALHSKLSEFGVVAKKDLAALRSGAAVQAGLKEKAEIGFQEALRQAADAQEEVAKIRVERELLIERNDALEDALSRTEDENASLTERLAKVEKEAKAFVSRNAERDLKTAKKDAEEAKKNVAMLSKRLDDILHALQKEQETAKMARVAAAEAESAERELRGAWRKAEDRCHEIGKARAEADASKRKLMEALVHERSARILAQQELESAAKNPMSADVLCSVDKARLALLQDELSSEYKSLELIVEAFKEFKAHAEGNAPATPDRR